MQIPLHTAQLVANIFLFKYPTITALPMTSDDSRVHPRLSPLTHARTHRRQNLMECTYIYTARRNYLPSAFSRTRSSLRMQIVDDLEPELYSEQTRAIVCCTTTRTELPFRGLYAAAAVGAMIYVIGL